MSMPPPLRRAWSSKPKMFLRDWILIGPALVRLASARDSRMTFDNFYECRGQAVQGGLLLCDAAIRIAL